MAQGVFRWTRRRRPFRPRGRLLRPEVTRDQELPPSLYGSIDEMEFADDEESIDLLDVLKSYDDVAAFPPHEGPAPQVTAADLHRGAGYDDASRAEGASGGGGVVSGGYGGDYPTDFYYSSINGTDFFLRNVSSCDSAIVRASQSAYLYGIAFLLVVAFLLNGLSVIVFRSKGLRRYPFSLYLLVVGIVDTLSLLSYVPRKWMSVFYAAIGSVSSTSSASPGGSGAVTVGGAETLYDTNAIACKALTYCTYVLRFLSSWLLVALGADRLLLASTPYKRSRYPTLKAARHGVCYCAVAAVLTNLHVLFVWDSLAVADTAAPGGGGGIARSCIPIAMSPVLSLGLTILTVVLVVALPFVVLVGLAVMILRNLPAWKLRPRRLSSTIVARALFEKDATVMVAAILVAYCVLCVPYIITWVVLLWQHFMDEVPVCRYIDGAAARDVAEVAFMINFAGKFVLCIFFGGDVLNQK